MCLVGHAEVQTLQVVVKGVIQNTAVKQFYFFIYLFIFLSCLI